MILWFSSVYHFHVLLQEELHNCKTAKTSCTSAVLVSGGTLSQIPKSMFLIFCLFLLTYIPFFCILVFVTIEGFGSTSLFILDVSTLIVMANSLLNPVVYCMRVRDLKVEAIRVIHSIFFCFPVIWCKKEVGPLP